MNVKRKVLWIAMVAGGLAADVARAQDDYGFEDESAEASRPVYDNYIELGVGNTEDGNGKFGEYTNSAVDAFKEDGAFPVGSLKLGGGDRDAAQAWEVRGGTGNGRTLEASYGVQGNYGISLYGDSIEKIEYGDAATVYPGGTPIARLPPGYLPGVSSGDPAFYNGEDIGSERLVLGVEAFKRISDEWTISFGFENQDKSGDDVMGGNQGFGGTGLVPEQLNHTSQQVRARVDYATSCLQQGIELYLSKFDNDNTALPYENANYAGSASIPLGVEQLALEPDNEFMRLGLDGGYTFDARTRFSWFADWSRGEQDEAFLPVVRDTSYYPTVNPAFPWSSLDGEVERADVKLALVGRPLARFDYRLHLDYKDRDATHDAFPANLISYTGGFSPGYSSRVYGKQTQELGAEAGYRFGRGVRLRAGYEYEEMDRDTDEWSYDPVALSYSPVSFTDTTDEDRLWAELKLGSLGSLSLKLRGEYNVIDADLSDETEEFISPGGQGRRATPAFLLDRDQTVYGVGADYALGHNASLYASYDWIEDDYDNDTYGLESRESTVYSAGINWAASKALDFSVYASREEYEIEQLGRQMGATPTPYSEWALETDDEINAFGLTMDWIVIEDRFDMSADLAYLDSESTYASEQVLNAGITLVTGETPDSTDEVMRLNIAGTYHYNDQIDVIGRLIYEDREAEDWGWTSSTTLPPVPPAVADPTQPNARYIAFGYDRPDYSSSVAMLSVRYKF
jgi:MtrB/PioB family decaheme-associated outer membrane protein